MKLTEIDLDNITKEIIKDTLFNVYRKNYSEADCLILFGCHLKPIIDERIKRAVEILKNKKVDKVILTGGIGVNGNFNEAEYMKSILIKNGVEEEKILLEDKSTTTEENIINSIKILKDYKLIENKKIILVSNDYHLRRIGMEFKKQLKNINYEIIYDYPENSLLSFEKVINDNELLELAVNEIKRIINYINMGIMDDENI